MLIGGFVCLLAGTLNATDVVWTGAVDSTWDTSTLNWLAGGERAAFAARDNVVFDDTSANATVTAGNLAVGRIVFSNDAAKNRAATPANHFPMIKIRSAATRFKPNPATDL